MKLYSDKRKIFFTADSHWGHSNILNYCSRNFKSIEDHNTAIINNWNNTINKKDLVFHLGDFAFTTKEKANQLIESLNGSIFLIRGNHDKSLKQDTLKRFAGVYDYLMLNVVDQEIDGIQKIVLFHYPILSWHCKYYGSWQLHGHCIDLKTEILTDNGWKNRQTLSNNEKILTLNLDTLKLEYQLPTKIIDINYTGNVVCLNSIHTDIRTTDEHILLDINRSNNTIRKILAKNLAEKNRRTMLHSAIIPLENNTINIQDDFLRLLIWIAADGSKSNSSLIRFPLIKERKIQDLKTLLNRMNIQYRILPQKHRISINFTLPYELRNFRLKPLDSIIKNASYEQTKIILEEYCKTDGHKKGNWYQIFTSKQEETDILQEICVKNGFRCLIKSRYMHGFSKKISYELSIIETSKSTITDIKNKTIIINTENEHFWCVNVPNHTIITRRNGKCLIMGNCHGKLDTENQKTNRLDCGVDSHNLYPISYEQIKKIIATRKANNYAVIDWKN